MGASDQRDSGGNGHSNGNGHGRRNDDRPMVMWAPAPPSQPTEDDSEVDLATVVEVLRDGWRAIALIAFAVLAATIGVTLAMHMRFKVTASLYMGDLKAEGGMLDTISSQFALGMEKGEINTEIAILRSRKLLTKAIFESGFNTSLRPAGWTPPRYFTWRLAHRDPLLLEGAPPALRAVSTQLTGLKGVGDQRKLRIRFKDHGNYDVFDDASLIASGSLGKPVNSPGLELTLLAGTDGPPAAGRAYELTVFPIDSVLKTLDDDLSISTPKAALLSSETDIIDLELTSNSPDKARMFLDELMRSYLDQNLAWKTEEAGAAEAFLAKQVDNVRASLDKAAKELAEFKKKSATVDVTEVAKSMIGEVSTFEQQRAAARLQVENLQQIQSQLAKGNMPPEAYLVGETPDTVLIAMGQALVKAEADFKAASVDGKTAYPLVNQAKVALDAELQSVQNYVDARLKRAKEQLSSLDKLTGQYQDKLKQLPDAEQKLIMLTQETEVYGKVYEFLLDRQQQAALTKASTISKSRILDPANFESLEAAPRLPVRGALGLGLGVLAGVIFVLGRWRYVSTFRTERELRKVLGRYPLFASVPHFGAKRMDPTSASPVEFLASDMRSPLAEAFRLLRTNIYYSGARDRDKVILISSPGPGDGKTATTLCLATMLAADGKRVLVIDGDMRKPSHHMLLRRPQHPGLSGILTNEAPWRDVVQKIAAQFGEVSAITTGVVPPNPAELLSSQHLATFLAEARSDYDFILIDSPPFPLVSDALVLAEYSNRILSVIRTRRTRRRAAEEHVRRLSAATTHYGIVVNDVAESRGYYGYGYGYGYGAGAKRASRPRSKDAGSSTDNNVV